jgi:hypothetical protein
MFGLRPSKVGNMQEIAVGDLQTGFDQRRRAYRCQELGSKANFYCILVFDFKMRFFAVGVNWLHRVLG